MIDDYLPLIHIASSNLKSWLKGCHHGVSPQHLQAHLNEFAFRFNRRFYPFNSFRSLLGTGGRTAGPTYEGLLRVPGDVAHYSGMMSPSRYDLISPSVPR
jgi:hypothetical protein